MNSSESPLLIGIDLGGTNTKAVVVHGDQVIHRHSTPTVRNQPADTVAELARVAADLVGSYPQAAGIGITVPGHVDEQGRAVVIPNIPGQWPGTPIAEPVTAATGRSVCFVNDARAFGLAELTFGAARGAQTAVGLVLGTGIGGVVIVNGQVHYGAAGQAGEIGHQVLLLDGPKCGCGNRGCLEALARSGAIVEHASLTTMEEVVAAAHVGNVAAHQAISTAAEWIGQGLANVVTVLQPEIIFLGGGVIQAGDLLLEPLRSNLAQHTPLVPDDSYQLVVGSLGEWAGAIGAAVSADRFAG